MPETRRPLRVTIAGGGPVGLMLALTLKSLMPEEVAIQIFDKRWARTSAGVTWRGKNEGNSRRQQVVTIQSRQYSRFPEAVKNALFSSPSDYSEMWPIGPDSPFELGRPRNMRIAFIEDKLLELADRENDIQLRTERFDPADRNLNTQHLLVISDGGQSATRDYFIGQQNKFGEPDSTAYSVDGKAPLEDTVLGLRVRSSISDSTAVLLTISQNRFLLNSLRGEGILNMRLEPEEVREVIGFDKATRQFHSCIQSNPCMMVRKSKHDFVCATHGTHFKPAIDAANGASTLWPRILEGLRLFGVDEKDLSGITAFRLSMVQRPRFTAELIPATANTPGTFGCLLGDAANAIHFWPGHGLNSGVAAAYSLAKSLSKNWNGRALRDADLMRHEAAMAMLQYRHKSRAWRAMITTDRAGAVVPIQQIIGESCRNPRKEDFRKEFVDRIRAKRQRLDGRLENLPEDNRLERICSGVDDETLQVLIDSQVWNTVSMGGEEADVEWLLNWASAHNEGSNNGAPQMDKADRVSGSVTLPAADVSPGDPSRPQRLRYFFFGAVLSTGSVLVWQRGLTQPIAELIKWWHSLGF
jgi:2-polyprenyl-6-methoxyphenol hydroxylase-like FAD-dependent oxidoreductase